MEASPRRHCCRSYIENITNIDLNVYYTSFREFRHKICNLQFKGRQTTLETFFRPRSRIQAEALKDDDVQPLEVVEAVVEASDGSSPAKKARVVDDEDESSGGTVIPSSSPLWDLSASPPPLMRSSLTSMTIASSLSPPQVSQLAGPSGLQEHEDLFDDDE